MDKKIIAFSSTHGTAKSSQAYMLCAKMKMAGYNVVVLDELARKCPFPINKEGTDKTQTWLVCTQIKEELELVDKVDYLIVDRGVADAYCYDLVLSKGLFSATSFLSDYVLYHIKKYYKTIYVPDINSFSYQKNDGVRDMDKKFREDVYNKLLDFYNNPIVNLPYKVIHNPEEVYEDFNL